MANLIVTGMWSERLNAYLEWLVAQGRRPHTVRGYRQDLRGLVAQAEGRSIGEAELQRWLASLDELAPATRARRRSAAKGFLRWAADNGAAVTGLEAVERSVSGAPRVAAPRRSPEWSAVEASLARIPRQADRDQLLFKLLALAGLRPGEALDLRIEDFDPVGGRLRVTGRGGVTRDVLIDDSELRLRLIHWIRATGRSSGPMFRGRGPGSSLRYESVRERWQRYATASGTQVSLSDLRTAHAARLLAGGVPEWVVRQRLGQPTGALPIPTQIDADEAILAWQQSQRTPERPRRTRGTDNRRAAG